MANKTLKVSNCWWDFCQLDSPMCTGQIFIVILSIRSLYCWWAAEARPRVYRIMIMKTSLNWYLFTNHYYNQGSTIFLLLSHGQELQRFVPKTSLICFLSHFSHKTSDSVIYHCFSSEGHQIMGVTLIVCCFDFQNFKNRKVTFHQKTFNP